MVERIGVSLPRLPAELDGLAIAVVADVHASRWKGGAAAVRRVVNLVNAVRADMIVVLGDVVHYGRQAAGYLSPLSELQAPLGIFACLGNHEHGFVWYSRYLGPWAAPTTERWRQFYAATGVRLLVNEAARVWRGGAPFWLVGVDDAYSGHDDLPAALRQVSGDGFRLAITHSPDVMDDPLAEELDLIVAGHTHGGQVRLPALGAVIAPCRRPRERAAGLMRMGTTAVYVTRGAGEGLPIRILCPRELPVLVLRRPEDGSGEPRSRVRRVSGRSSRRRSPGGG